MLIFLYQFIIQGSIVIVEKRVLWAELNWVTGTTHHDFQELVLPKGTGLCAWVNDLADCYLNLFWVKE